LVSQWSIKLGEGEGLSQVQFFSAERERGGWCARAQVSGSPQDFPKTKEQYVNWGDLEEDGERGGRFRGEPLEPYTLPLAK
jgi:hypothetical protein